MRYVTKKVNKQEQFLITSLRERTKALHQKYYSTADSTTSRIAFMYCNFGVNVTKYFNISLEAILGYAR